MVSSFFNYIIDNPGKTLKGQINENVNTFLNNFTYNVKYHLGEHL